MSFHPFQSLQCKSGLLVTLAVLSLIAMGFFHFRNRVGIPVVFAFPGGGFPGGGFPGGGLPMMSVSVNPQQFLFANSIAPSGVPPSEGPYIDYVLPLLDAAPIPTTSVVVMTIPCQVSPSPGCSLRFLDCSVVLPSMTPQIAQLIDWQITDLYAYGINRDPLTSPSNGPPLGTPWALPICNLDPSDNEETNVNVTHHPNPKQASCGNFQVYNTSSINLQGGNGTRETAYLNGVYIQALKCFKSQVFQEIQTQQSVTIQYMKQAALELNANYQNLIQLIYSVAMQGVCGPSQTCPMSPAECLDAHPLGETMLDVNGSGSCPRQAICQLITAEDLLQAAYQYIVYQEIQSRALYSWLQFMDYNARHVYQEVESICVDQAANDSSCRIDVADMFHVPHKPSCVAEKINACYPGQFLRYMRKHIQQYTLPNGSCQPPS